MAEHLVFKGTFYEVGKQLVSVFICISFDQFRFWRTL